MACAAGSRLRDSDSLDSVIPWSNAIEVVTNCGKKNWVENQGRGWLICQSLHVFEIVCIEKNLFLKHIMLMSVWESSTSSWICESMNLRLPQGRPPQRWRHLFLPECCVILKMRCYCWSCSQQWCALSFFSGFANPESSDDCSFFFWISESSITWGPTAVGPVESSSRQWQWLIKLRSYLNPVPGVSWISSVSTCDYNIWINLSR